MECFTEQLYPINHGTYILTRRVQLIICF